MGWLSRLFGGDYAQEAYDEVRPAGLLDAPRVEQGYDTGAGGSTPPERVAAKRKEREMAILRKDDVSSIGREASSNINALLGKGSEFEGKLTFEGTVRIDGRFNGEIFSEETLVVGEGAKLRAEINVGSLVLYGEIIGNVRAHHAVELHSPARLIGNIQTPALMIEAGVIFEGASKMENLDSKAGQFAYVKTDVPDIKLAEKK